MKQKLRENLINHVFNVVSRATLNTTTKASKAILKLTIQSIHLVKYLKSSPPYSHEYKLKWKASLSLFS